MITRIEIDGFKSFVDFELDIPPFLVVMGGNASGKSNLVDALTLLADSARSGSMLDSGLAANRGIPAEFFHQYDDGTRTGSLRILVRESEERAQFRTTLSARLESDGRILQAEVTGSVQRYSHWASLGVVPRALRERGLRTDQRPLQADGNNLASVVGRIEEASGSSWEQLLADAVALLPELRDLRVEPNRDYLDLELNFRGSGWMSARTASDGTLRVLAILAAAHDPQGSGMVIVDEVENGLHPSRLADLMRRLRSIADASLEDPRPRQIVVTSHSPVVLSALYPENESEVVFLSTAYGPRMVGGRKVGSLRTIAEPVGRTGLPRSEVRRILGTVQPLEPPR